MPEFRIRGQKVHVRGKKISRENVKEYQNERRVKELSRRGYDPGQISAMMQISTGQVQKMKRHTVNPSEMRIDGTL